MDAEQVERALVPYAVEQAVLLSSTSSIPIYYRLFRLLKRFIETRALREGDRFPAEETISSLFGVSRPTTNRAMQELVAQGWLARERGRGAFVRNQGLLGLSLLSENLSLTDQFPADAILTTRFLDRQILEGGHPYADILGLTDDSPLLFLRRLRLVDGKPVMICDSYLSASQFADLRETAFVRGSLYATFEERYGLTVSRSDRKVIAQELIDESIAESLEVPLFSPILLLTGLSYVEGAENPIEYMVAHVRECVAFTNTILRKQSHPRKEGV